MKIRCLLGDSFAEPPFSEIGRRGVDNGTVGRPFRFSEVETRGEVGGGLGELVWGQGDGDEGWVAVEGGMRGVFVEDYVAVLGFVELD